MSNFVGMKTNTANVQQFQENLASSCNEPIEERDQYVGKIYCDYHFTLSYA